MQRGPGWEFGVTHRAALHKEIREIDFFALAREGQEKEQGERGRGQRYSGA